MICEKCGSKNIYDDGEIGETCCDDCGYAWKNENNKEVVEFHEVSNGQKARIGTTVSYTANRDLTVKKARNRIEDIASKIGLPQSISDHAVNVYKSALNHHLTQGIPANIMAGACLYLSSRLNNKPIFMLEISDKINTNVYTLGKVYKNLKDKLGQSFYDTDPCLFIERFAHNLDLGDKTSLVSNTALKILCRMKKDWISTGRRPTGLTAIALLISCLIHRFDRNFEDVSRLAGVSKQTVKRRMQEFFNTATAKLSLSQFKSIDLEDETNPPAYERNIEKLDDHADQPALTETAYRQIEGEIKTIMEQLNETEENSQFNDYSKLIQSVKNKQLDTQSLLNMVSNEDEYSDDNDELADRAVLLGQCLDSSRLNQAFSILSKHEDHLMVKSDEVSCIVSKTSNNDCYFEENAIEPAGLPFKIPIIEEMTVFPDITSPDDPLLAQFDDEELDAMICSDEDSIKKLKWFFNQKENRDYFRQKKKRDEQKAKKLQLSQLKPKRNSKSKRKLIDAVELVAEFDKDVEQAKRARLTSISKSERSVDEHYAVSSVGYGGDVGNNLIDDRIQEECRDQDFHQCSSTSNVKYETCDEEYEEKDENTSQYNRDDYNDQFSDFEEF